MYNRPEDLHNIYHRPYESNLVIVRQYRDDQMLDDK